MAARFYKWRTKYSEMDASMIVRRDNPLPKVRGCRIYCDLELNLRIKPRKRLRRDKPDALAVPDAPNMT